MNGGSLTVTEASEASARFEIGGSSTLTADGRNALFIANGDTKIDGGSFFATAGGKIRLPQASSYSNSRNDTFRATGAGSLLDLRSLTSITGSFDLNQQLLIEALAGGKVDLSAVTQIVDPSSGDARGRRFVLNSDGVASQIDLSGLQNMIDTSIADWDSGDGISRISAANSGVVVLNATQTSLINATTSQTDNGMILGQFGLQAAGLPEVGANAEILADDELRTIVQAGIEMWAELGLSEELLEWISAFEIRISNLPGSYLGHLSESTIWIDRDAAGFGWFVDATPWEDEEFDEQWRAIPNPLPRSAGEGTDARGRIDLLTVVLHEMGHLLGLGHDEEDDSLMSDLLAPGQRRRIAPADLDAVFAADAWHE